MGDPRNIHGLSYNVGTCTTQGVSILQLRNRSLFVDYHLLTLIFFTSSIPAQLVSPAPAHPRSSRTVMPQTHTAATETTLPLTKATARSTASKPSPLSTASSHRLWKLLSADYPSRAMGCWIWPLRASYSGRIWLPRIKVIWYLHFKLIILFTKNNKYCEHHCYVHLTLENLWQ